MLNVDIPGFGRIGLDHLVLDYNGTLAVDGTLRPGVAPALNRLAARLAVHVVSADTYGQVRVALAGLSCQVVGLPVNGQAQAKRALVERLGAARTVCIGNGRIDRLMLAAAAVGIVVVEAEGAAVPALLAADIVCRSIGEALDLLLHPLRLTATLRS